MTTPERPRAEPWRPTVTPPRNVPESNRRRTDGRDTDDREPPARSRPERTPAVRTEPTLERPAAPPALAPRVESRPRQRESTASIPELKSGWTGGPTLRRFERTPAAPPAVAPTPAVIAPATRSSNFLPPAPPLAPAPFRPSGLHSRHERDIDVNVRFWFGVPRYRHVCWNDPCGIEYGYVFCGSSVYSYSFRSGCEPCFTPYSYYWAPSSYWLPAYCPTYATVRVVHEYVSDAEVIAPDPAADPDVSAPAHAAAEVAQLLADGWTQFQTGAYSGALDAFRQAVLADPDDVPAKIAFAQALFAIGNYADAAFMLRRTVELLPDWPALAEDPRGRYGDPLDHAEQMVALRAFLERLPGDPAATLVLAVQSFLTGDLSVARDSFGQLQALDPDDRVAAAFLTRLGPPAPSSQPPADANPLNR